MFQTTNQSFTLNYAVYCLANPTHQSAPMIPICNCSISHWPCLRLFCPCVLRNLWFRAGVRFNFSDVWARATVWCKFSWQLFQILSAGRETFPGCHHTSKTQWFMHLHCLIHARYCSHGQMLPLANYDVATSVVDVMMWRPMKTDHEHSPRTRKLSS